MKPSAYRSMVLAKEGKTKERDGNLKRWINEDWRNLTPYAFGITSLNKAPKCGDSSKNPRGQKSVCRPMKTVSKSTPVLATAYTKAQIKKAVSMKNEGKTIRWGVL